MVVINLDLVMSKWIICFRVGVGEVCQKNLNKHQMIQLLKKLQIKRLHIFALTQYRKLPKWPTTITQHCDLHGGPIWHVSSFVCIQSNSFLSSILYKERDALVFYTLELFCDLFTFYIWADYVETMQGMSFRQAPVHRKDWKALFGCHVNNRERKHLLNIRCHPDFYMLPSGCVSAFKHDRETTCSTTCRLPCIEAFCYCHHLITDSSRKHTLSLFSFTRLQPSIVICVIFNKRAGWHWTALCDFLKIILVEVVYLTDGDRPSGGLIVFWSCQFRRRQMLCLLY